MSDFLPKEVREGLKRAQDRDFRRKNRLRVRVGEDSFPIRRFQGEAFTLDIRNSPYLRGFVDIYDGGRHLYQALIVTAAEDGPEMRYEFKRMTPARHSPPRDFEVDETAPKALLPRF